MDATRDRRLSPDTFAVLILSILASPMAIPTARKFLGHNSGFLRDLVFFSGPSGTAAAWILSLLIAVAYIGFAVRTAPPVARTWIKLDWRKMGVFFAAIA